MTRINVDIDDLACAEIMRRYQLPTKRAAALYRRCRREGETVRKLMDCLIAAVAIRAGVPILHNDPDFDVLARHTELLVYQP